MRSFRIDLATEADVPRMLEISNWAAEHTTANFATLPELVQPWTDTWRTTSRVHPWLVARSHEGAIVGFAKSSPHRHRQAYDWSADVSVYVDPAWHGRRVGTAVYGALIPLLRDQGYVTLIAGITDGNAASEKLHTKVGFSRCGTFHRIGWKFGHWCDVSYWELHLQPADHAPRPIRPVAEVWSQAVEVG